MALPLRVELWGKQRVLRGDGKVCTVGKPLWTGLIASFPNLSNTVHSVTSNDDGDVVAQVDVAGTQQLAWGLIAPAGRRYCEPHLFIFHVGADLLIDSITAYWSSTRWSPTISVRRSRRSTWSWPPPWTACC
jgi:hypothetical protein